MMVEKYEWDLEVAFIHSIVIDLQIRYLETGQNWIGIGVYPL